MDINHTYHMKNLITRDIFSYTIFVLRTVIFDSANNFNYARTTYARIRLYVHKCKYGYVRDLHRTAYYTELTM